MEYPKWLYHATLSPALVEDPEQEDALGEGWADTPAAFLQTEPSETTIEVSETTPEPVKPARTRGKKDSQ